MQLATVARDLFLLELELGEPLGAVRVVDAAAADEVDPLMQPPTPLRDRALLLLETDQTAS